MADTVTVPRADYDALEASLAMAEALTVEQARRIGELDAQLAIMRAAIAEALDTLDGIDAIDAIDEIGD